MNQGGEPAHDDYGLPRVDIQVPDDARELYRDVQAYHRELRALRRHERSRRWHAPLRVGGVIIPVIAGCLVLAMIAGMVLTMFSANPFFAQIGDQTSVNPTSAASGHHSPASAASSPSSSPRATESAPSGGASQPAIRQLPRGSIRVAHGRVSLRRLRGTALAIIPARCDCAKAIGRLLAQVTASGITLYLVGGRGSLPELNGLAPARTRGTAMLAIDARNTLSTAYRPSGLMILFVDSHGNVVNRLPRAFSPGRG